MSSKTEIAHTVGILLGLKRWEPLLKLPEAVLDEIYRNYIINAREYNHLEDDVKDLHSKLIFAEAGNARKSQSPTRRR